jgi:hypothetical protein
MGSWGRWLGIGKARRGAYIPFMVIARVKGSCDGVQDRDHACPRSSLQMEMEEEEKERVKVG